MLIGQFLVFPNWILLVYLVAGSWLVHRQVLREEDFLQKHYGQEYVDTAIESDGIFEERTASGTEADALHRHHLIADSRPVWFA